ncbi:MAG: permease-like cell division protein FtsX [Saprospiraceae bacterium]
MTTQTSTRPNYFYAIISVALVLFLLGLFAIVVMQGQQMVRYFKEQIEIIVELKDGTSPADQKLVRSKLESSDYLLDNSIRFISKEEGAAIMQKEFGDEFLQLDMPNPLYDVILFRVKAEYLTPDSLSSIREALKELPLVSDVYYQEDVTAAIGKNLKSIAFGVLIVGIFCVLVAIALILNTIRLALYANRFLIKNMELVGASWSTISKPFLRKSFFHGIISGLLAIGGIVVLGYFILNDSPELAEVIYWPGIAYVFGGILVAGAAISVLSTYWVVSKYLRMRVDDLY